MDPDQCRTALTLLTQEMRELITPLEAHRIKAALMESFDTKPELTSAEAEEFLSVKEELQATRNIQAAPSPIIEVPASKGKKQNA